MRKCRVILCFLGSFLGTHRKGPSSNQTDGCDPTSIGSFPIVRELPAACALIIHKSDRGDTKSSHAEVSLMYRLRSAVALFVAGTLLAAFSGLAIGQNAPPDDADAKPEPSGVEGIQQDQPDFLVRADVDRFTNCYREGDALLIRAVCEVDAYVYVLYKQADGEVYQIYPNSSQPENRVKARQAVAIPGPDDLFRWVIGPPFGKEIIKVIASQEPLQALSDPEFRRARFNRVWPEQVKGIELELGKEQPPPWAEDTVEIQTFPKSHEFEATGSRRYGLFIGVGEYEFAEQYKAATNGKGSINSPPSNRDARRMAKVLGELGQLSDYRVLANDTATRENIEAAITGWLASRSRPGDTVFIYFSGMTMRMPKGFVYLLPYDHIPGEVFTELLKQYNQGQLDRGLIPRVETILSLVRSRGESLPSGRSPAVEALSISDVVLTHWLQRLAGRQVVLIFDVPSAGAFAPKTKDLSSDADSSMFKSLETHIARLNELGQREIALLAACGARQHAVARVPYDVSGLTLFLELSITEAAGPLTLDEAHKTCVDRMATGGEEINRDRQAQGLRPVPFHRPLLFNCCTKPVYLKP